MGITIFARGKIDRIENIPLLIEKVKQFAGENNWTYHIIDDDFHAPADAVLLPRPHSRLRRGCCGMSRHSVSRLGGTAGGAPLTRSSDEPECIIEGSLGVKGIILNAGHGVEMLAILFDQSGTLTDMMQQVSWIHNKGQGERFTACKTQFGSIEAHIRVIELFDLLKKKYISNLIVDDEGAYWESRDRRILAEKRVALGHAIRHTERVISGIELSGDDARDPEALASRIEDALLKAETEDGLKREPSP